MTTTEIQHRHRGEHAVTPLELFFDLVLVFAITQVTRLLGEHPTWSGVLHGMLVLAALWWAWNGYAWLTSAADVDEGSVRLAMLAATVAMFVAALAVPHAFGGDALLFGCAYLIVRVLHVVLSLIVAREEPDSRDALLRFAPTALFGASLLVLAAFLHGNARVAVWVVALAIDYLGPALVGMGRGWRIAPVHFAERYGLIILIALGESMIAIGVGAGATLTTGVLAAAALGLVVVSTLWWLYFDVAAIFARRRLAEARGIERARIARDSYSYLHLPMVAGIVLFALGLETAINHIDGTLAAIPAAGLCGGVALYLLGQVAFLYRSTSHLFRRRTIAAIVLLALIPAAAHIPALAALGLVSAVCAAVVAYEALRWREQRLWLRHPEGEA